MPLSHFELIYITRNQKTEPDRVGGRQLIYLPSPHTTVRTVRYTAVQQSTTNFTITISQAHKTKVSPIGI